MTWLGEEVNSPGSTLKQAAELNAWVAEQMTHFGPGSLDAAVEIIRASRRKRRLHEYRDAAS